MQAPQLIGPTGNPMIALGGEYAWKQFQKGDVVCALQWINSDPSICLFPATRSVLHQGAYVIGLSALHKYVESNGTPTRYMIAKSIVIAEQLGFTAGKDICFRIIEMVLDAAQDLVKMIPEPEAVRQANKPDPVGDIIIKQGGRTVYEAEA